MKTMDVIVAASSVVALPAWLIFRSLRLSSGGVLGCALCGFYSDWSSWRAGGRQTHTHALGEGDIATGMWLEVEFDCCASALGTYHLLFCFALIVNAVSEISRRVTGAGSGERQHRTVQPPKPDALPHEGKGKSSQKGEKIGAVASTDAMEANRPPPGLCIALTTCNSPAAGEAATHAGHCAMPSSGLRPVPCKTPFVSPPVGRTRRPSRPACSAEPCPPIERRDPLAAEAALCEARGRTRERRGESQPGMLSPGRGKPGAVRLGGEYCRLSRRVAKWTSPLPPRSYGKY